jgi:hypothetical protein
MNDKGRVSGLGNSNRFESFLEKLDANESEGASDDDRNGYQDTEYLSSASTLTDCFE